MYNLKSMALVAPTLLLMSVALCSGCKSGFQSGVTPIGDAGRGTQITTGDEWIRSKVEIRNVRGKHSADNRLTVQFELYNAWHNPMPLRWAVSWFDLDGMMISGADYYQEAQIAGEQSTTISVNAPNVSANNWKIDLQPIAARR